MRFNRAEFEAVRFRPRVLIAVASVSTSRPPLFPGGAPMSFPAIVAPMAMQRLARPDVGELGTAGAANKVGIPMCLSTTATESIESIAATGVDRIFQLYIYKDRSLTLKLVRRAKAAGYGALVLTVDSPLLGRRERDLRNGFTLPEGLKLANFDSSSKKDSLGASQLGTSALEQYWTALLSADLTWEDVSWLVREAHMPVWVKGIVREDDAARALQSGVAAIVVSNHGGRQLDSVVSTLEALPSIVAAVNGRVPVLVDSGVRRGGDIAKAIALGADAVMIGRPVLWGLAVEGERGALNVLEMIRDELRQCMQLLGAKTLADISKDCITYRTPSAHAKL